MKNASFAALALVLFACSEDETKTPDGETPDENPSETCSTKGTGTIDVVVEGLPADVAADVKFAGAFSAPAVASTSLPFPNGSYTVTAAPVAKDDPIVRTLYRATVDTASFCLAGTKTVKVTYTAIGSSNKLWSTNQNNDSGQVLGFAGSDLGATATKSATVKLKGAVGAGAGRSVAFDKDGNMWAIGGTTTDGSLLRFAASDLGSTGTREPDRKINITFDCLPALSAIAFAPNGDLWATNGCGDEVIHLPAATLAASGDVTPTDGATGVEGPKNIAFDKDGGMWVSATDKLHHFSPTGRTPDFSITLKASNSGTLAPDALAFDAAGSLWISDFAGNAVMKLGASELVGPTREITPATIVTIGVTALLEGLAFDESGGLWLTYTQGKLARLAAAQLGTSSDAGSPTTPATVITSADLGSANGLALFPAPAGLPLYSSFR